MTTFQKIVTAVVVIAVTLAAAGGYVIYQQQAEAARVAQEQADLTAEKHRQERADKAEERAEKEAAEAAEALREEMILTLQPDIERSIRRRVERVAGRYGGNAEADVGCTRVGDTTYECLAKINDEVGGPIRVMYEAQVDPATGGYTWEATSR